MTFGELEVGDQFRSDAVAGARFRKAPGGMGECIETPLKSQFFHDAAPVALVKKGKESQAEESVPADQSVNVNPVIPPADDDSGNSAKDANSGEKTPDGTEAPVDADAGKKDGKGKK